mmetsp:Transcript_128237/g.304514  ORF Transcript_128237/g.304514 Transcript_128237/m.304514 type:complete len:89 (-) Transcript_128237:57-323(-)
MQEKQLHQEKGFLSARKPPLNSKHSFQAILPHGGFDNAGSERAFDMLGRQMPAEIGRILRANWGDCMGDCAMMDGRFGAAPTLMGDCT